MSKLKQLIGLQTSNLSVRDLARALVCFLHCADDIVTDETANRMHIDVLVLLRLEKVKGKLFAAAAPGSFEDHDSVLLNAECDHQQPLHFGNIAGGVAEGRFRLGC